MKAYLADVDKVTAALRDHIWSLSGGIHAGSGPADAPAATTASSSAGRSAGTAATGGGR